jgi:hypothetical protein
VGVVRDRIIKIERRMPDKFKVVLAADLFLGAGRETARREMFAAP